MKHLLKKQNRRVYHISQETVSDGDTSRLPTHPVTKRPIAPMAQPGYYPSFDVLSQQAFWDEATRKVVLNRVNDVPPIRFFSLEEARMMQAVCNRLLPQDDRDEEHKIPVVNYIDNRLYHRRIDGYRYESMPPDHEAHLLGLQAIDTIAKHMYDTSFVDLDYYRQDVVLKTIHDAKPPAAQEVWLKMPVHYFWMLIMQDVVNAYYAHPYAWNEIGFGGPAYPRGYMRLEGGKPEPWEVEEQRYAWEAPVTSLSGKDEPLGGPGGHKQQPSGQGGVY